MIYLGLFFACNFVSILGLFVYLKLFYQSDLFLCQYLFHRQYYIKQEARMMDNQLEHTRDIWVNAFFTGNYDVLAQYEDEHFKVIYEKDGRIEGNFTRYEKIAHAVKNGVWKPQKPNVKSEEYEFNREQTLCMVLIHLEDSTTVIQEQWVYEQEWKITELRFLKS